MNASRHRLTSMICALCLCLSCIPIFSASASAEELAPGYDACMDKPSATTEMMECLSKAYQHWDAKLNANYKKRMKQCESKEEKDRLLKAQRAWLKYKQDMQEYIINSDNGTMSRMDSLSFAVDATKMQAKLLESGE